MERFKDKNDIEERKDQYERLIASHPVDVRVPVICEPLRNSKFDTTSTKTIKLLCSSGMTVGGLQTILRRRIPSLKSHEALFLLVGEEKGTAMACAGDLLSDIYNRYRNEEDGFLYVTYSPENTFG